MKKEDKEEEVVQVEEEVKTGAPNSTLRAAYEDEFSQFEKPSFFKQKAQNMVTANAICNVLGKKGNERFEMKKLRMQSNLGVKF